MVPSKQEVRSVIETVDGALADWTREGLIKEGRAERTSRPRCRLDMVAWLVTICCGATVTMGSILAGSPILLLLREATHDADAVFSRSPSPVAKPIATSLFGTQTHWMDSDTFFTSRGYRRRYDPNNLIPAQQNLGGRWIREGFVAHQTETSMAAWQIVTREPHGMVVVSSPMAE